MIVEVPLAAIWTASGGKRQPVFLSQGKLNRISALARQDAPSRANLDSSDRQYIFDMPPRQLRILEGKLPRLRIVQHAVQVFGFWVVS